MKTEDTLALLQANDPARDLAGPTEVEIDLALASILGRTAMPAGRWRAERPRRSRWLAAVAASLVCVAATAVVLANVLPGGTPGTVQGAWARSVLVKAAASVAIWPNRALYIEETVTSGGREHLGGRTVTVLDRSRYVGWEEGDKTASTYWRVLPRSPDNQQVVTIGRTIEVLSRGSKRINESRDPPGTMVANPIIAELMLFVWPVQRGLPEIGQGTTPSTLRAVMVDLLRVPGIRVRRATLGGRRVIRVTVPRQPFETLYLRPGTYTPLEVRRFIPVAGHRGGLSNRTEIDRFDAFRRVPRSALPANVFNLARQHPDARVIYHGTRQHPSANIRHVKP